MNPKHTCCLLAGLGLSLLGFGCQEILTEVHQRMIPQPHTVETDSWIAKRVLDKMKKRPRAARPEPPRRGEPDQPTTPEVEVAQTATMVAARRVPKPQAAPHEAPAPSKPTAPKATTAAVEPPTALKPMAPLTPVPQERPVTTKPPVPQERTAKTKRQPSPPGPAAAPKTTPPEARKPAPTVDRMPRQTVKAPTDMRKTAAQEPSRSATAAASLPSPPRGSTSRSPAASAPPAARRRTVAVRYDQPKPMVGPRSVAVKPATPARRPAPIPAPKVSVTPVERQPVPVKTSTPSDRQPGATGGKSPDPPAKHQPRPAPDGPDLAWSDPRILAFGKNVVDVVVAKVNGDILLGQDVFSGMDVELSRARREQTPEQFNRFRAGLVSQRLASAVRRRLVLQQAEKDLHEEQIKHVEREADKEFTKTIAELKRNENVKTLPELKARLEAKGRSLDRMKRENRDGFVSRAFLAHKLRPRIFITRDEMLTFYSVHKETFQREERIYWRQITVRYTSHGGKDKARVVAQEIRKQLVAGADFAELAKRSGGISADKGGDMGWTRTGSLSIPALASAVESLKPGQVSEIVEGPTALHIVRVDKHEKARTIPFGDPEAQKLIRNAVSREKENAQIEKYVDELRRKAHIQTIFHGQAPAQPTGP